MTRPCDRCGAKVADTVGERQCSLLDPPADPRSTDAARLELRQGRILCPACQRTGELYPDPSPAILASVDAAMQADALAELDDEPRPTGQLLPTLDFDASEQLARALWQVGADGPGPRIAWVGQIDRPGGWNHRARLDGAHRALDLAVQIHGGRVVR